jgi:hypothetical protein
MYTHADVAYLESNYTTLDDLCADRIETAVQVEELIDQAVLPHPSYVLEDGTGMFPADYFRLVDEAGGAQALRRRFADRHRAACALHHSDPASLDTDGPRT